MYDIEKAFRAVEDELMKSMIRNMKMHCVDEVNEEKEWEMWQTLQLQSLEEYKRDNQKKFRSTFSRIDKEIAGLISEARSQGNMEQEIKILEAIKKGFKPKGSKSTQKTMGEFFKLNDRKLNALINATKNDFHKAERAVLRMAEDQYRQVIFNAQVYANTGAGTYAKAVDMATKDFLSRGINCIEYSNGARHTISDYAAMAIQTASKRAYLTGEGEKRKEWGITTVIMNKRGNACPKCLPFVGKVLIDDVWSGGKQSDGPYMLMSFAMAQGLYHPRCKDTHTTYFEGISTPGASYTKNELALIENNYRQEQKQQYAKRQEERFGRLAEYSLDEENKKKYETRKEEWKTVAKVHQDDIMESDLGIFKEKLRNDKDVSKEYYSCLKNKFAHGKENAKKLFAKYAGGETVEDSCWEGIAKFEPKSKKISMHYMADLNNPRGAGATWFHEHGHLIDNALGNISKDKTFLDLLKDDAKKYRLGYGEKHHLTTWTKVDKAISMELSDMRKHSSISDLFDGITKGNIRGCAGHPIEYWENETNITGEAFAHMFEAQFDSERYKEMEKYFPESLKYFENKLKEVVL